MNTDWLQGLGVALVTPMDGKGLVDYAALDRLVQYVAPHCDYVVALGTTGEPCTLTVHEKQAVVHTVSRALHGGKPLVVGAGGNNTEAVKQDCALAASWGADAVLVVTPYYNRCTQQGLVRHYAHVQEGLTVPIVLYNVPKRTGVNIEPDTLRRLAALPHVAAIKEASGNMVQAIEYVRIARQTGIRVLGGDDLLYPCMRAMGAAGLVSAAANAIPQIMRRAVCDTMETLPDWVQAYAPLLDAMYAEVNPIGVKAACRLLGLCGDTVRLPLTTCTCAERIARELQQAKLQYARRVNEVGVNT